MLLCPQNTKLRCQRWLFSNDIGFLPIQIHPFPSLPGHLLFTEFWCWLVMWTPSSPKVCDLTIPPASHTSPEQRDTLRTCSPRKQPLYGESRHTRFHRYSQDSASVHLLCFSSRPFSTSFQANSS